MCRVLLRLVGKRLEYCFLEHLLDHFWIQISGLAAEKKGSLAGELL